MSFKEGILSLVVSIRGIFEDRREAQAVALAKIEFRARIHMFRVRICRNDPHKYQQLKLLDIELDAATKKVDINRLVKKFGEIMEVKYPQ